MSRLDARVTPAQKLERFIPAEPGWIIAALAQKASASGPAWWDIYPLIGWAELSIRDGERVLVPVPGGLSVDGHTFVEYQPDDAYMVLHVPHLFRLSQSAPALITRLDLDGHIATSGVV